jgi:hypothetical protein
MASWKETRATLAMAVLKTIVKQLLPWLEEEAKKTETPLDDKVVAILKSLVE